MGVEPELGRGFLPQEDQVPGRDPVVVLGHDFWEKQLGADRSIIGRKVRLDGIEFTVVGVAPERFTGMDQYIRPAVFVPLMMAPRLSANPERNTGPTIVYKLQTGERVLVPLLGAGRN